MPWGDGTGPWGLGPMTGRAAGYCAGFDRPGYANPAPGFGRGLGRGFGRGFARRRFWFARPAYPASPPRTVPVRYSQYPAYQYTKEDEIAGLKADKEALEQELGAINEDIKAINERLKELETKK